MVPRDSYWWRNNVDSHNSEIIRRSACTTNLCSLFLAGTDTTALTLSWTMYYLVKHPEAFARCRAEALEVAPARCVKCFGCNPYQMHCCLYLRLAADLFYD